MMRKILSQTAETWNYKFADLTVCPDKQGGREMVKRTNTRVASKISKLNENETLAVRGLLSTRTSKSKENSLNDDLIVSLSDAYENKRARQVVEWENLGRQNLHQNLQRATWFLKRQRDQVIAGHWGNFPCVSLSLCLFVSFFSHLREIPLRKPKSPNPLLSMQ